MELHIRLGSEGDPLGPFLPDAVGKLENVFKEELTLLFQESENYAEAEVSVSFLNRAEMTRVNEQYRGLDEPTDVLTFPMWEEEGRFSPPGFATQSLELLPLGDIVICLEEAEREHSPATRIEALCLVLAHGFLHLLGWDHDTPEKEDTMWERQDILKSKLLNAIERGLLT
jgi:probable rRNA maturation factor